MKLILILFFVAAMSPITFADDQCNNVIGLNLAGPEFGKNIPGVQGRDYFFPSRDQIAYYKNIGFHSIRLPILWERLQPELYGPLDKQYLAGIISVLDSAAENDMPVVIDLHNYAHYRDKRIGSPAVPDRAFFDVWQKIASALNKHKALYAYGLMNEPYDTGGSWPQVAQLGVDGIRSVDNHHRIYVGIENAGDSRIWESNFPPFIKDPVNLEVYETHTYFDADYSGKYSSTAPRKDPKSLVEEGVDPFIAWLKKYGKKGAIGEWGVPNNDERWFPAVDRMVEISRNNCLPIYYWAAGNWGDYKLSLGDADSNSPEPLLTKHFKLILK